MYRKQGDQSTGVNNKVRLDKEGSMLSGGWSQCSEA